MNQITASMQYDLDAESLALIEKVRNKRRTRFPRWCILGTAALYYLFAIQVIEKLWNPILTSEQHMLLVGGLFGLSYLLGFKLFGLFGAWNFAWWYVTHPKPSSDAARVLRCLLDYHKKIKSNISLHESLYTPEEQKILSRSSKNFTSRKRCFIYSLIASAFLIAIIFELATQNLQGSWVQPDDKISFQLGLYYAFMSGAILTSPIFLILQCLRVDLLPWQKHERLLLKSHDAWQASQK